MKKLKFLPILTFVVVIAVWYLLALSVGAEVIMPSPHLVVIEAVRLYFTKNFILSTLSSLWKILLSFLISLVVALPLAIISARSKVFETLLYPIVVIVRATPTMSLIFLCLIWFSSITSPLAVSFAVLFPLLYSTFLNAIKNMDKKLIDMAKVYKVPTKKVVVDLYLPSIAKSVYGDLVNALSFNVKLVLAAEALSWARNSLGSIMANAKANIEVARLFAVTIFAIILSYLLELLLKLIKHLVVRFYYAKTKQN